MGFFGDRTPGFDTKVWEIVRPHYDEETNRTKIEYNKYIKRKSTTKKVVASRTWDEEGDTRPRLREAGYLGSDVFDSSGKYEEWVRESFDYLTNYQ